MAAELVHRGRRHTNTHKHTHTQEDMGDKAAESGVAAMAACYQGFDPPAYLQYNYTPPRADFQRKDSIVPWKLACLHRAFTEGEEESGFSSLSVRLTSGVLFSFSFPQETSAASCWWTWARAPPCTRC